MLAFLDNNSYTCLFYRIYVTEKYTLRTLLYVEIVARSLLRGLFFQVIISEEEWKGHILTC